MGASLERGVAGLRGGRAKRCRCGAVRVPRDQHISLPARELARGLGVSGSVEIEEALRSIYRNEFHRWADELGQLPLPPEPQPGDPDGPLSEAERGFVDGLGELLRAARYEPISCRDVEAAHAINGQDYLTQVVIRAKPEALSPRLREAGRGQASLTAFPAGEAGAREGGTGASSMLDADDMDLYGRVQVWRKGYKVERRQGRLLLEKLDYLQSKSWTKLLGLQSSDRAERRAVARLLNKTEELARAEGWLPEVSERADSVLRELGDGEDGEVPRFMETASCSEAFEGVLKRPLGAPGGLFGQSELVEPLLGRVFLLYVASAPPAPGRFKTFLKRVLEQSSVLTEKGRVMSIVEWSKVLSEDADSERAEASGAVGDPQCEPRLKVDAFADLPWSGIRLIFPERRLAFRPVELVRLDLLSFFALIGLASRWKFVANAPETFDPEVLIHDAYINSLALATAAVVLGRLVLSWQRAFKIYELKLARIANERRTTAQGAALQELAGEASAERTKEVLLAWAALRKSGGPLTAPELRAAAELHLRETFHGEGGGAGDEGPGPALDGAAAAEELLRVGLAEECPAGHLVALEPGAALVALRAHWNQLFAAEGSAGAPASRSHTPSTPLPR